MLRIFSYLREREFLTPAGFLLAFLFILSLIIILGQTFHQTMQEEMASQFNAQQLLIAQQIAINIESFLDHVYEDISVISNLPDIQNINRSVQTRSIVEGIYSNFESDLILTLQVVDRSGTVLYDSFNPDRMGSALGRTKYFLRARTLQRDEYLITTLMNITGRTEESKQFAIVVPIHQLLDSGGLEFNGAILAVLSLDGITQKYLAPITSGTRGYAWMMESDGTLLYHPTQPQMVGKNLFQTDHSCFECHRSFNAEKRMVEGKAATFGFYEAPGGENKLAAYYKLPVGARSWFVVVSAPYSDVIALMRKSRIFYSLLIVSIFITTLVVSAIAAIIYRKKIKAEEKARHLENQRRLEQEIVISRNYLENIIENTKTNLMVLDSDLIVRTVNSAQAQTLARDKKDILDRPFFSLFPDRLRPYEGIPIEALFEQTRKSGKSFEIKEYPLTGLRPEPVYFDMIVSPLLIAGSVTGIVITSTNVTTRVHLEEALKKYTSELEERVEREIAEHRKLEQQVLHSEKLAALGRLAAGVAHEIGNPLTSISTFAQLLREMASDEFTQTSLDTINTHIQRIAEIVRQMSAFSRPGTANIERHQINDILSASLDLMRFDKRMKSTIEIVIDLAPDLPETFIDDGQIAQVFINIILNALDAMPESGKLTVRSGLAGNGQDRDFISVAISDTGVGIPESDFARIFDPFYTTKEAGKGTGLGLSVSYNIVKRFKGDIKVSSEKGKGTTFTIVLPVVTEMQKEPVHAKDEHPGR